MGSPSPVRARTPSRSPSRGRSRRRSRSRSSARSRSYSGSRHRSRYDERPRNKRYSRSPSPPPRRRSSPRRYRSRSASPTSRRRRPSSSGKDCRVYVSNLAYDARWTHLKDFMREDRKAAGKRTAHTTSVSMVLDYCEHIDDLRSVVEYRYPEDAQRAIRTLNKVEFMGRPVFIREDREFEPTSSSKDPRKAPEDCRLHVGNDMKDLFRKAGRVLHTDIITDPDTRRSTGSGLVVFDDARDARAAIGRSEKLFVNERNRPPPPVPRSSGNGESRESRSQGPERSEPAHQSRDAGYGASAPPPPAYNDGYDAYNATPSLAAHHFPMGVVGGPGASLPSHGPNQIFVNNDLIDLFRHVGPVVRSEILLANGHPKGSGLVRFEDFATCERAIDKFHGYLYGGRYLDIRIDKFSTSS
ncbi:hypothetical protein EC973_004468 [Apophysomyces ossiformis]|uniref:RRM domain-containing protein n=1 Tax=Apophysomyces ossiformis TaxID=679940 RepID=A0A8H7ELR3_9FUNG|nr:hypothetical protein EC973_004468 [Apophysomyces ossiformis]